MKTSSNSHASELNPPENITPSIGTTINGILILLPLTLVLVGLFSHVINP
ncbi:purine permease [Chamaesiphon sp.]